jgi:hypothetical protein
MESIKCINALLWCLLISGVAVGGGECCNYPRRRSAKENKTEQIKWIDFQRWTSINLLNKQQLLLWTAWRGCCLWWSRACLTENYVTFTRVSCIYWMCVFLVYELRWVFFLKSRLVLRSVCSYSLVFTRTPSELSAMLSFAFVLSLLTQHCNCRHLFANILKITGELSSLSTVNKRPDLFWDLTL